MLTVLKGLSEREAVEKLIAMYMKKYESYEVDEAACFDGCGLFRGTEDVLRRFGKDLVSEETLTYYRYKYYY